MRRSAHRSCLTTVRNCCTVRCEPDAGKEVGVPTSTVGVGARRRSRCRRHQAASSSASEAGSEGAGSSFTVKSEVRRRLDQRSSHNSDIDTH